MENEENIVEQAETTSVDTGADTPKDLGQDATQSASTFGKFRDAKSLLDAYNNLQSEFTRKSQRLAELEKLGTKDTSSPSYTRADWHEKLSAFLDSHSDARKYADEISSVILEDKDVANSDNSLELAWLRVMSDKYISPDSLDAHSDLIDKYLSSHEDIKEKIINEYLDSVKQNRTPPLMSSRGSSVASRVNLKSMDEAKDYVMRLFKN